ncbi:hypothetical protein N7466_002775 [Penicillium verhagenii]|uniref:uncharacterized protein n=1 Tax=Penicillium verhagenii TaxID=1562060 RepID=UPI0025450966|nr:uncharacterized protein N7466_002775 [Penicillium verhagenii]KAJ5939641.1 hypothetical protein N7466_002775 [Penicillium verhagenii]
MASEKKKLRIASVGSSFAAGPGIPPQIKPFAAGRSGQNYPHLLAKELNADLTDLSVSGATLLNITAEPQVTAYSDAVFPPQILSIPEDADIITITAGGNDIGYIGNMIQDAADATYSQASLATTTPLFDEEFSLPKRLGDTLDRIHEKAPKARIYVVEYLAILGPCTKPKVDIPFNQERIDHHSRVASRLQNAYAMAVATRSDWCERVPIHQLSLDHALGSQEPWVSGFDLNWMSQGGVVLHPNLGGMQAVAGILLETIRKETPRL